MRAMVVSVQVVSPPCRQLAQERHAEAVYLMPTGAWRGGEVTPAPWATTVPTPTEEDERV